MSTIEKTPLLNRYNPRNALSALADYEAAKGIAESGLRAGAATWVGLRTAYRDARGEGATLWQSSKHAVDTVVSWPSRACEGFIGSSWFAGGKAAFLDSHAISFACVDRAKALELAATDPALARVLAPALAGAAATVEKTG